MQHAPITTPITDKLASMTWIRWFRQLVDRVDEIKGTADAPAWDSITGKPTEFPPSEHRHEWTDLDDVPTEFPPDPHTHPQYLTEETDPTVPAHVKDISTTDIDNWNSAPSVALNDLTDVDTAGQTTGDVLTLQSDGLWKPQAPAIPISGVMYGKDFRANVRSNGAQEYSLVLDPIRRTLHWSCSGVDYSMRSYDGGYSRSSVVDGFSHSVPTFHWDEYNGRLLYVPNVSAAQGYSSIDSGTTWTSIPTLNNGQGGSCYIPSICSMPSGRLVKVGQYYGDVYYSDNAGVTWTYVNSYGSNGQATSLVMYSSSQSCVWFVKYGTFYWSDDGATWNSRATGISGADCVEVTRGPFAGRFIVCNNSTGTASDAIRISTTPKTSWSTPGYFTGIANPYTIMAFEDGRIGIINRLASNIYTSFDGGVSWLAKPLLVSSSLLGMFGQPVYMSEFQTFSWYNNTVFSTDTGTLFFG